MDGEGLPLVSMRTWILIFLFTITSVVRAADLELRLGVLFGITSLGSENPLVKTALNLSNQSSNFYPGLWLQLDFARYFTTDLEFFYGIPIRSSVRDKGNSIALRQMGGLFSFSGRMTFKTPEWTFIPRFGPGLGAFAIADEETAGNSYGGSFGVSAVFGLETRYKDSVFLLMDYALPIAMFGTSQLGTVVFNQTREDRFRIALEIPLSQSWLVGVQWIRRGFSFVTTLGNLSSQTSVYANQALGMILVRL